MNINNATGNRFKIHVQELFMLSYGAMFLDNDFLVLDIHMHAAADNNG